LSMEENKFMVLEILGGKASFPNRSFWYAILEEV